MSGIILKGDWRKARRILGNMTELNKAFANEILEDLAFEVKDKLEEVLGSEPSPSNAESTIIRKGFDASLKEKGELQNHSSVVIEKEIDARSNKCVYTIKGNPNKYDSRTGLSFEDIVTISETGGGNVPARDVLTITYSEMEDKIEDICLKRFNSELRK